MSMHTNEPCDSPIGQRPDASHLREFFDADAHLFPLTAFNDETLEPRYRGKKPWRKGWNKSDAKPLTPTQAQKHMEAGRNVGDRLRPTDLVIDIDPRSFGDGADYSDPDVAAEASMASLKAWCAQLGFDSSDWPIYLTGRGGLHVRLKKPNDLRIVGKLADRPGFEFKTAGTFVVAPGSVHAKTGCLYRQHPESWLDVRDAPEAPETLLALLRRPEPQLVAGGGELTPEQLAGMLAALDVTAYRDHDKWFSLMCASHEATGGAGEDEFLAWSAADPMYADQDDVNRTRWESLQTGKPGNATARTLYKAVIDAGHPELLPNKPVSAAEDFDEEIDPDHAAKEVRGRPVIRYKEHKLPQNLDQVERAFLSAGAPLFQMQGQIVRPIRLDGSVTHRDILSEGIRREPGALVIRKVDPYATREEMLRSATFLKYSKRDSAWIPGAPPLNFALHYHARVGTWRLRALTGIIEAPTLRADGSLLSTPGYDEATGLILDTSGVDFPPIAAAPSYDDALRALSFIKEEVLIGFPFVVDDGLGVDSAARSVALSAILTGCVRKSIRTAPLHAFSAPTMATGKTLLCNAVSMIAVGRGAAAISQGRTEEEDEKRLFSILRQGDPVVLIDNIEQPVHGDALCTILTEATWQCRVLGVSENQTVPTNALFLATGNNLVFQGDVTTRVIMGRLDAHVEAPEKRVFKVDLREHIPAIRPQLVTAALTVLRAFIVADRPGLAGIEPFGRFEEWSNLVRGALIWLGEADPCATRGFILQQDSKREALTALMNAWQQTIGFRRWVTAKEIVDIAEKQDDEAWDRQDNVLMSALEAIVPRHRLNPNSLGNHLAKIKDRIIGGCCIHRETIAGESSRYALVRSTGPKNEPADFSHSS